MAALVQTLPQQTTVTMLSGRPNSSGGGFSTQGQQQHHVMRNPQMQRYGNPPSPGSYRGLSTPAYAFTNTPPLNNTTNTRQYQMPHLRSENRTSSAPIIPQFQQAVSHGGEVTSPRPRYTNSSSLSNSASSSPLMQPPRTLDDAVILPRNNTSEQYARPQSIAGMPSTLSSPNAVKPSPDRYRRNVKRVDSGESGSTRMHPTSAASSGSGMAFGGHLYNHPVQSSSSPALNAYQTYRGTVYNTTSQPRQSSSDDIILNRSQNPDLAKRYRRRSLGGLETAGLDHAEDTQATPSPHPNAFIQQPPPPPQRTESHNWQAQSQQQRPGSSHNHSGSADSVVSSKSSHSSQPSSAKADSSFAQSATTADRVQITPVNRQDMKVIHTPARINEALRRNPSPLSQPANLSTEQAIRAPEPNVTPSVQPAYNAPQSSPAAEQLASVNQKNSKKPKSKLRRAFSFGSSQELRRATAQNNMDKNHAANASSKRNSKYEDEMDPEEAKIARKQEAGGIGESIYSGQGNFFTGSTDNLSISSTASSASIMLRKMGSGMKKGTRSLVGLFRPKSVIGVPAADGPVTQAPEAQVSMVTVEAEREKVNVNVNPHDHAGGGTGYPRLERNSLDASKPASDRATVSSDSRSRRSIVGGERERAEVLAAVKKGILKRNDSGQSSPKPKPLDFKVPDFNLPQIPHMNDSPRSSAPSTPADENTRSGHRRTDSIAIEGTDPEDYFASMTSYTTLDPKVSSLVRNISFSPHPQFHVTWPSEEYDRRGEIATCNRLTPMLAQQIKEELNTFKMEMEVHESSKVYTHFF